MGIKKNLKVIFLFFFFLFFLNNTFAEIIDDAIEPFCEGNLKGEFSSNLELEELEIKINRTKQWNENLFKIYLNYQKKKNKSEHKNWVSNFRITDKFKKKYKAKIIVKYKNYKPCTLNSKVRITGDLWWHLDWQNSAPAASIHVQLLNGHILNVTKFKLFLKKARYGKNEIFVSNFFKELGYISPKTFLIKSKVNNIPIEYIFQEDLKKELIESSKYREGPILEGDERFTVKLTDDETVNYKGLNFSKISNKRFLYKDKLNTFIGVEAISNLNKVYRYNHQYKFTEKILDPFEDIFFLFTNKFFKKENIELLNIFESLSYALDSKHGLSMDDRRYYYDSYTKLYLPIYYDGKSKILDKSQQINLDQNNKNITVSNEAILGAEPSLNLLKEINIDNFLNSLNKSGLKISKLELVEVLDKIKKRLQTVAKLNIKNINFEENKKFFEMITAQTVKPNFLYSNIKDKNIFNCDPEKKNCKSTNIKAGFLYSLNEALSQDSNKIGLKLGNKNPNIFVSDEKILKSQNFIFFNNQWKKMKLNNTQIEFINVEIDINKNDKTILIDQKDINGKIIFIGGELKDWKVLFYGSNDSSTSANDLFNTGNLTGCLSFYEVLFDNVKITSKNSFCEDSVNIIRSNGVINKILITNSFSDSLDVDFSDIIFKDVKIVDSKNDCIDFSYGNYIIDKADLAKCGDKGVSIGEKSKMKIKEINIDEALIGIASKDSSIAEIINGKIDNTKICLSAYRKKIEFSGGKLILDNVNCKNKKNFFSKDSQVIWQ